MEKRKQLHRKLEATDPANLHLWSVAKEAVYHYIPISFYKSDYALASPFYKSILPSIPLSHAQLEKK